MVRLIGIGMLAPGKHTHFDSLRGAPPPQSFIKMGFALVPKGKLGGYAAVYGCNLPINGNLPNSQERRDFRLWRQTLNTRTVVEAIRMPTAKIPAMEAVCIPVLANSAISPSTAWRMV